LQVQTPEFQSTTTDTTILPSFEPVEGIPDLIVVTTPSSTSPPDCEQHMVVPLDLLIEQMLMQVGTFFEDVVVVEDASDDEETDPPEVGTAIEDPLP
jgi:hypothetical protein